jgi:dTDP-4-amino-4,6-dideoxygalactose transaminase
VEIRQTDPGAFSREHRSEVLAALMRVLDSGWYVLGAEVSQFEAEFAAQFGLGEAIGVANGTDAISIALRSFGIGAGSRVACPSYTAVATVAAIDLTGALPVFVDIDPITYAIDPDALMVELEGPQRVDAIVAVHLYGHPADMDQLLTIGKRFGIPLIEDCAQAHGARIRDRFAGSMGDAAAFSFYPTKNLGAIGDGGLVSSVHPERADAMRSLRQYGWRRRHISEFRGVNSRLDELQAAYLRARLPFLEEGNQRRTEIAAAYNRGLRNTGLILPTQRPGARHVYHQYVVRFADRDGLQSRLRERGIATAVHYPMAVHCQPAYQRRCAPSLAGLRETEKAAREVLSLPMYPELTDAAVAAVIEGLRACL